MGKRGHPLGCLNQFILKLKYFSKDINLNVILVVKISINAPLLKFNNFTLNFTFDLGLFLLQIVSSKFKRSFVFWKNSPNVIFTFPRQNFIMRCWLNTSEYTPFTPYSFNVFGVYQFYFLIILYSLHWELQNLRGGFMESQYFSELINSQSKLGIF